MVSLAWTNEPFPRIEVASDAAQESPTSLAGLQRHHAAGTGRVGGCWKHALIPSRDDVVRRRSGGVHREMPAPAGDRRQQCLNCVLRHVEEEMQIFLVGRETRNGAREEPDVALPPGGRLEPGAVPGDVRDPAVGEAARP